MAKTLLNAVNEVLKNVSVLQGSDGELSSLSVSSKQIFIDTAVQALNETIDELYSITGMAKPNELAESTITLVASTRNYTLATDLVQIHFPLLDETNGQYLVEYPGGYMGMVRDQQNPSNYTGLAQYAVIRPTDGALYLDRAPTTVEAGRVYKYRYDKDVSLSAAADTVPFSDAVFRAVVPAVAQIWRRRQRNSFDGAMYRMSMGRAARLMNQTQTQGSYISYRGESVAFDPMEA